MRRDIDPTTIAPDVPRFLSLVTSIPWLTRLGKPHPRDGEVVRITDWRGWPGPERGFGDMFGRWPAFVKESIEASEQSRIAELKELWESIYSDVLARGAANVPEFDPAEDAWYGPTACVDSAAFTAALVGWHDHLRRPLPKPIAEQWRWYADGHWPCDFAEAPVGLDESLEDVPEVRLLVL